MIKFNEALDPQRNQNRGQQNFKFGEYHLIRENNTNNNKNNPFQNKFLRKTIFNFRILLYISIPTLFFYFVYINIKKIEIL